MFWNNPFDMGVRVHLDTNGEDMAIEHVQDVEPVIEQNKAFQKESQKGDFRLKASIPYVTLVQWLDEEHARGNTGLRWGSVEFDALIKRKLADPDNRDLLTGSKQTAFRRGWGG